MDNIYNAKKAAQDLAMSLGTLGFDIQEFCRQMRMEHRANQATFTHLCLQWLKTCAEQKESGAFDGRNDLEVDMGAYLAKMMNYHQRGSLAPTVKTVYGNIEAVPYEDRASEDNAFMGAGFDINFNGESVAAVGVRPGGEVLVLLYREGEEYEGQVQDFYNWHEGK